MVETQSFKRLILRVVLRQVSPMVIRLISVPDDLELIEFHEIFRTILGWSSNLDYIFRVHGQEFNSFRRPHDRKPCRISGCIAKRNSCMFVTQSTCGNGMSALSISNPACRVIALLSAWAGGVPLRRNSAVAPAAIVCC